jgi:hypothetical protein
VVGREESATLTVARLAVTVVVVVVVESHWGRLQILVVLGHKAETAEQQP